MREIDDAGWREATPSEKSQTINISTNVYDNINILQNATNKKTAISIYLVSPHNLKLTTLTSK